MFPPGTHVLVVDDMSSLRDLVKAYLRRLGYLQISEAADGREAYQTLVAAKSSPRPIELIICDWNMPVMNGVELLKNVRAQAELKTLPFILLTTESEKNKVIEAVTAGVSNYMVKPVEEKTLAEKMLRTWEKIHPKA